MFYVIQLKAAVVHVPSDQPDIQSAINYAVNGDTVLVADGIYTGALNRELTWNGEEKHLVIRSENGYENCIINCQQNGRAFTFDETFQDSTDIIDGFQLINGTNYDDLGGGAIACLGASPTITNNKIFNNFANEHSGGGIYLLQSDSKIIGNIISYNSADYSGFPGGCSGGGIFAHSGSPYIANNVISYNSVYASDYESSASGGGISAGLSSYMTGFQVKIINNLIIDNSAISGSGSSHGGGITLYCYHGVSQITGNTIVGNTSGSAVRLIGGKAFNNIIFNNSNSGLKANLSHPVEIRHNNIHMNGINFENCPEGIGDDTWGFNINGTPSDSCYNISTTPNFISNADGQYFLSQIETGQDIQSPCVDAGFGDLNAYNMESYTTRIDYIYDMDPVDIGYHYQGYIPQGTSNPTIPASNYIISAYPNPFNPTTVIRFQLSEVSGQNSDFRNQKFEIEIFNVKGQKIKSFLITPSTLSPINSITWNGTDNSNNPVSSGIYFYTLMQNNRVLASSKMLLMK